MGFPGGLNGKESAWNAGEPGSIPGREHPLEKGMATHSSVLAWKIPWTEELGRLQSMVCKESDMTEQLTLSLFIFFMLLYVPSKIQIFFLENIYPKYSNQQQKYIPRGTFLHVFQFLRLSFTKWYFDNSTTLWYLCVDLWLKDWIFFSPKEFLMASLKTVK